MNDADARSAAIFSPPPCHPFLHAASGEGTNHERRLEPALDVIRVGKERVDNLNCRGSLIGTQNYSEIEHQS